MSQNDFNVANQNGVAFRADVNSALQALASLSAGDTAPSTTYAYQLWGDTTTGLLKIRNGANNAWVILGPLADSTQRVLYTNNLPRVYINADGEVGIGEDDPQYALDVAGSVNVTGSFLVNGAALATGYSFINGGTSSNASDVYTSTPSPAISAYAANQLFLVLINSTNTTTTPTFNFNSQGAKTVKKQIGGGKVALSVGDLQANTFALMAYDGTDLILINPRPYGQGADIASAGTINLTTATGDYVHVTGTTTITAVTLAQGRECTVVFDGALTLTNGASLILPGGANITTAAGDIAVFRGEASSVVRCVSYIKASGAPVVSASGGALKYISSSVLGAAANSIGLIDCFSSTYDDYILKFKVRRNHATQSDPNFLLSDDSGSTYETTGFTWMGWRSNSAAPSGVSQGNRNPLEIMNGAGVSSNGGWCIFEMKISVAGLQATGKVSFEISGYETGDITSTTVGYKFVSSGTCNLSVLVDSFKLFFGATPSTNGVAAGSSVYCYGVSKS